MKTKLIALALAAIVPFGAVAQTSQKITAGKATEYGLAYSLPVTALDITVEAELTEENPGEFYNYARRHLGDDSAIRTTAGSRSSRAVPLPS